MKPITDNAPRYTSRPDDDRDKERAAAAPRTDDRPRQAQCCAKVSNVVAGCHD